jgi:hypothetical protein
MSMRKTVALIVISGIILVSSLLYFARVKPSTSVAAMSVSDPEDQAAWAEFVSLVHPLADGAPVSTPPSWETWKGKCAAGLIGACLNQPTSIKSDMGVDAATAEIPRQVLADFGAAKEKKRKSEVVKRFAKAPQLGSVLFDEAAVTAIGRGSFGKADALKAAIAQLDGEKATGADRHLPTGSFDPGSEVIKLVWEVVSADSPELTVYNPSKPAIEQNGLQLYPLQAWPTFYSIDPDTQKPCNKVLPPYGDQHNKQTISINCFYWFDIRGGDGCKGLSIDVAKLWCTPAFKQEVFYSILVGFHVMKLTPKYPNWTWMTFYWTRDTNDAENPGKLKWSPPWNRFHLESTAAIREQATGHHRICYNPYLEGTFDRGLTANCLSCHSFAAYAPDVSKLSDGTEDGEKYPYPLAQRASDEQKYFQGAVQTSFIWSISTTQNPQTAGLLTVFENAVEEELLHELHSK